VASDQIDIARLAAAHKKARLTLKKPREWRKEAVRQYAGPYWSEEGTPERIPVNLIALYCGIVSRSLIAKNPRFALTTTQKSAQPTVAAMERWLNTEIVKAGFASVAARVVLDGLFSIGIAKVALATPSDAANRSWALKAGMPFVAAVDLDDFVFDVHARDFREASFIGHRFRVPLDTIKDSKLYSKARKKLEASADQAYNAEGDQRVNTLGRSFYTATDTEEFEPHVDLWEYYLPRHRLVVTVADDQVAGGEPGGEPLRVQRWIGPDEGPYHFFRLADVPGNPMPKAPVQDLYDLHLAVNNIYRKLIRQAERQKEVSIAAGGASEDGSRVVSAADGEMIRLDRPESVTQVNFGGPNQANFLLGNALKDTFSYMGGNLEVMAGLAAQSKTATQDTMLNQNAGRTVSDMQDTTVTFVSGLGRALLYWYKHHPTLTMESQFVAPGVPDVSVSTPVSAEDRAEVRWDSLDLAVDPYSMQHQTPQSRMQVVNGIVQQIAPFMALAQQQGVVFDLNAYVTMAAKLLNIPDLKDVLKVQEPPQPAAGGGRPEEPGMQAETTRNYVRTSQGADSTAAKGASLEADLEAGAGKNGSMGRGE
jgi:hypothetical protein